MPCRATVAAPRRSAWAFGETVCSCERGTVRTPAPRQVVRRSDPTTVAQAAATAAAPAAVCRQPTLSCASPSSTTYQSTCAASAPRGFAVADDGTPGEAGVVVEPGQRRTVRRRPGELGPQLGAGTLRLGVRVVAERRALDGDQVAAVRRTDRGEQAAPPFRQPARVGPPCGQPDRVPVLHQLAGRGERHGTGRGQRGSGRVQAGQRDRRRGRDRKPAQWTVPRRRHRREPERRGRPACRRGHRRTGSLGRRTPRPDAPGHRASPHARPAPRGAGPVAGRAGPVAAAAHPRPPRCPAGRPRGRPGHRPRRAVRPAAACGRPHRPAAPAATAPDRHRRAPCRTPSTTAARCGASARRSASACRSTGGTPTRATGCSDSRSRAARISARSARGILAAPPSSSAVTSSRTAPPTGTRHAATTRPPDTRAISVPECPTSTTTASSSPSAPPSGTDPPTAPGVEASGCAGAEPSAATAAGTDRTAAATVGGITAVRPRVCTTRS